MSVNAQAIITKEQANKFLPGFLKKINTRFTAPAQQAESVFRVASRARELDRVLCLKETRVVNSDHTISYEGLIVQLPRSSKYASIAKQRVEILQLKRWERRDNLQKTGNTSPHRKSYGANDKEQAMTKVSDQ